MRGEFDAVIAPYHDVGMTAIKVASFGSAVNVTLGLPFPRTSPDHGTALDIAGKGSAECVEHDRTRCAMCVEIVKTVAGRKVRRSITTPSHESRVTSHDIVSRSRSRSLAAAPSRSCASVAPGTAALGARAHGDVLRGGSRGRCHLELTRPAGRRRPHVHRRGRIVAVAVRGVVQPAAGGSRERLTDTSASRSWRRCSTARSSCSSRA